MTRGYASVCRGGVHAGYQWWRPDAVICMTSLGLPSRITARNRGTTGATFRRTMCLSASHISLQVCRRGYGNNRRLGPRHALEALFGRILESLDIIYHGRFATFCTDAPLFSVHRTSMLIIDSQVILTWAQELTRSSEPCRGVVSDR
jgi:hypothetical protein